MQKKFSRCLACCSKENLAHNYRFMESAVTKSSPNCRIMAVVKANAYGHGLIGAAKVLAQEGCRQFAVAELSEGKKLRKAGIEGEILVLGRIQASQVSQLVRFDLTQTVGSKEYAQELEEALQKKDQTLKIHLEADTGMHRSGFWEDSVLELAQGLEETARRPFFRVTGLFTHLSSAGEGSSKGKKQTVKQLGLFLAVKDRLTEQGLTFETVHVCNSAAALSLPAAHFNAVRVGLGLYGYSNDPSVQRQLKPVLSLYARVVQVQRVNKGEAVGYGATFVAGKSLQIATLALGYADGFSRRHSNKTELLVQGASARVTGRVCMDQTMIDVTGLSVNPGDTVSVIGGTYGADRLAKIIGTIPYEVFCSLTARVKRKWQ